MDRSESGAAHSPTRTERLVPAVGAGIVFFGLTLAWLLANDPRRGGGDFTYAWLAARALIEGRDPYSVVLAESPFRTPFFYPLPAALIALPFAWLPARVAGAVFVGVGFGWLAYHLAASGRWRLLVLTSAPALFAVLAVQWSPLLTAATLSGPALALVVAKPTLGVALAAYAAPTDRPSARRFLLAGAGVAGLVGASLLLRPDWPVHWLDAIRRDPNAGQFRAPITTVYGVAAVLALLRWRRPEARLLFVLACVRQNGFLYDQLPLLLVPATGAQAILLSGISHVSHVVALWQVPPPSILALNAQQYPFTIAAMYIPCVVMVLRRPNEGPAPSWVNRLTRRWPDWARGRDTSQASVVPGSPE